MRVARAKIAEAVDNAVHGFLPGSAALGWVAVIECVDAHGRRRLVRIDGPHELPSWQTGGYLLDALTKGTEFRALGEE